MSKCYGNEVLDLHLGVSGSNPAREDSCCNTVSVLSGVLAVVTLAPRPS